MIHSLYLGAEHVGSDHANKKFLLPAHHLVTHGVVVGMTGSGKTGLVTVMVEEALRAQIPVLAIDVKGDLPNLLLAFPSFATEHVTPWALGMRAAGDQRSVDAIASEIAGKRQHGLQAWGLQEADLAAFRAGVDLRVITPGSTAGEPLFVLSSLERRSPLWDSDPESASASLSAAVSLLLRLVGRDPDPARSKEHVLLAVLAERRCGRACKLASKRFFRMSWTRRYRPSARFPSTASSRGPIDARSPRR